MIDERGIPRTKRIGEIKRVEDLEEGERAFPESNQVYKLSIDGKKATPGDDVDYLQRRGEIVFAYGPRFLPICVMSKSGTVDRKLVAIRRDWAKAHNKPRPKLPPRPH